MKKVIIFLMPALFFQKISAQVEVKKPEEVFSLFYNAFAKQDKSSLRELNDYSRPIGKKGEDMYPDMDSYLFSDENIDAFLKMFPGADTRSSKKEAKYFLRALNGQLKSTSFSIENITFDHEKLIVSYVVNLQAPLLSPDDLNHNNFPIKRSEEINSEEFNKALRKATQEIEQKDKLIKSKGNFTFHMTQIEKDNKIYYSAEEDFSSPVFELEVYLMLRIPTLFQYGVISHINRPKETLLIEKPSSMPIDGSGTE